jgi:predicted MFS family arabinose efflux permease
MLIPIAVLRIRTKPAKARAVFDITALKDLHYMILVAGCTIGFAGLYVGFYYLSFFGQSTGITDTSLSFYLVSILNAASVFGRTLPNILADKIGPLNVIAPGEFCSDGLKYYETLQHKC